LKNTTVGGLEKNDLLLIKSLPAVKVADHLEDEHVDTGLCTYARMYVAKCKGFG
jgi:hypothetical protein